MKRLMVALSLAQATTFFKQAFEGTLVSMLYVLLLGSFTGVFWYYLENRPLITPDKFPEDDEMLNTSNLHKWWTNYTHPMVAKPNSKLDRSAMLICTPLLLSLRGARPLPAPSVARLVGEEYGRAQLHGDLSRRR